MARSYRTTTINVDSRALSRLLVVAREVDLYGHRREAEADNYEELIDLLCDHFQEGGEI